MIDLHEHGARWSLPGLTGSFDAVDPVDPSDPALLAAWRGGDRRAGSALFLRHYALVNRFFRSKANAADVADLIQSTFVACVEGQERYTGAGTFQSWLLGIAFRLLCRHYRSKQRLHARIDFASASAADLAPSPSAVVAAREEERLVLAALRRIPLEHQTLLELVFWESFTAADAAVVLGLPLGTVKSRIRRAHQLLREAIAAQTDNPALLESTQTRLEDWARGLRARVVPDE